MKDRSEQIEEWLKKNPRPRILTVRPEDLPEVKEIFDKNQVGTTWGAYRRRKHNGSDMQ